MELQNDNPAPESRRLSASMISEAAERAWLRFPLAVAWLAVCSFGMIEEVVNFEIFRGLKNLSLSLIYGGFMGFFATIAVTLWCEFLGKKKTAFVAIASVLVATDAMILYFEPSALTDAGIVGRIALGTALVVASLFVPAKVSEGWHFTWSQVCNLLVSFAVGQVCIVAMLIIFLTIGMLFDANLDTLLPTCLIIGGFTFPAIMFLGRTPTPEQNLRETAEFRLSAFTSGFFLYFCMPLTLIYLAVLLVYGLKILVTWSLPIGSVTVPCAGLCAAVLFLLFFLEGVRRSNPSNRVTLIALKWLPWLTLPVILLMSVAIVYRIAQYGITAPRLYVLLFNVWCWVVFILLGLKEKRRYDRVARSFALIFAAVSILPWANFTTLGKLLEHPVKETEEVVEEVVNRILSCNVCSVPEGFKTMQEITINRYDRMIEQPVTIDGVKYAIPVDSVSAIDNDNDFESFFLRPLSGSSDSIFVVKTIEFRDSASEVSYLKGYLFTK